MKRILVFVMAILMLGLAACGGNETKAPATNVDMQALYTTMEGTLPEMVKLDESMMLNLCGVKAENCKQVVMAVANDGLRADEVWLIEAVDAAAAAEMKTMAENRLKYKGEESITYSPEQYAIVTKAQVITDGNYLVVLVSPDVDALQAMYNTAAGK